MTRIVTVAAAQLGPIQLAEPRAEAVGRMVRLMERAHQRGVEVVVFPELALTTFFPRHYHEDRADADRWFETSLPSNETAPLFEAARRYGISFHLGYAEKTPDGHHFNTAVLVGPGGEIMLKYRKVHLPGHADYLPHRKVQHLEKRYFEVGDLGFPVIRAPLGGQLVNAGLMICNDRRWPEAWRVLGLQSVELVMLGYNTPSTNQGRRRVRGAPPAGGAQPSQHPGRRLPELDLRRRHRQGRHRGWLRAVRQLDHREPAGRDHGRGDELERRADHRRPRSRPLHAGAHDDLRVRSAPPPGSVWPHPRAGRRRRTRAVGAYAAGRFHSLTGIRAISSRSVVRAYQPPPCMRPTRSSAGVST